MLSREAIKEFKKIYERRFNQTLSDKESLEMATNLINLFKVIYRPIIGDGDEKSTPPKNQVSCRKS